ncbi:hypothetical protein OSB04_012887 [Centaurea solstitialis]|uniref:Uncharacterized protein n=1 Tax=Centaurea solstitialis TaxID=347529 RepID=A0AA38TJP8_9ASTR|nr:hypothetical protein OSB04_012887 [Centaurea solstitialis]
MEMLNWYMIVVVIVMAPVMAPRPTSFDRPAPTRDPLRPGCSSLTFLPKPGRDPIERMSEFQLAEGVDNTGVTTKFLACNCSINLLVNIKSSHSSFGNDFIIQQYPFGNSIETHALYASTNGPTSFLLYLGTSNKPMYGAGRSMEDILDSRKGLSLVVHVKLRSRFHTYNINGGLAARYMALTLSQKTTVARERGQYNSSRRFRNQAVSATTLAIPRYSASALERETTCCRLEDQETRLSPRYTQNPEVDRRVVGHPAQSASE